MQAWLEGLIILVHRLYWPRQSLSPLPDRNRLPHASPQLADWDVVPLDGNAVRSNVDDWVSILEIHEMELDVERHPQITSQCVLDPH